MGSKDVDIKIGVSGVAETERDLDRTARGVRKIGGAAESAGKKVEHSAKMQHEAGGTLEGLTRKVKGFIVAWLAMNGVQAVLTRFVQKLQELAAAIEAVQEKSLGAVEGFFGLASQLGDTSAAGQRGALDIGTRIQQAGGFKTAAQAQAFAISADVQFAGRGGLAGNVGTAETVAGFFGSKGATPAAASAGLELLGRFGQLGSSEQALLAGQQAFTAFQQSQFTSFSEFLVSNLKGATTLAAGGGTFEQGLLLNVRAREVTATGARAGTFGEQFTRAARGSEEQSREFLIQEAKTRGLDFESLNIAQRNELFMDVLRTADRGKMNRIEQIFPAEVIGNVIAAFSPRVESRVEGVRKVISGSTAADAAQGVEAFRGSPLAQARSAEAAGTAQQARQAMEDPAGFFLSQARAEARRRLETRRGTGKISALTEFFRTDEAIFQDIQFEIFREAIENATASGELTGEEAENLRESIGLYVFEPGHKARSSSAGSISGKFSTLRPQAEAIVSGGVTVNNINNGTQINREPNTRQPQTEGAANFESE